MMMGVVRSGLVVLMIVLCRAGWAGQEVAGQALFADMGFERGFLLSYPDSSRGRAVEAVLNFDDADNVPAWRLCQWSTKYTLANAPCVRDSDGSLSYANEGKRVVVGRRDSQNPGLTLEIRGCAEYGEAPRKQGQSWPHLLVEQDAVTLCPLDESEAVRLQISLRLMHCTNHMADGQFDPGLHAAQFQMFFIVKNIEPSSGDYGGYFWFGVPFFDNRHEVPPVFMARDAGKDDATGKFIYTVDGRTVGVKALKPSQWLTLQTDLLPHIRTGLQEAVKRGYLKDPDPHHYAVANMNLGWEIPGTFDAAIQVRDLRVLTNLKATASAPGGCN